MHQHGRRFALITGAMCAPSKKKGGDSMVTYPELFQFCLLIVAIISLIIQIFNNKKYPPLPKIGYFLASLWQTVYGIAFCIFIILEQFLNVNKLTILSAKYLTKQFLCEQQSIIGNFCLISLCGFKELFFLQENIIPHLVNAGWNRFMNFRG